MTRFTSRPRIITILSITLRTERNSAFCSISIRVLCRVFLQAHKVDRLPMAFKTKIGIRIRSVTELLFLMKLCIMTKTTQFTDFNLRGVNTRVIYPNYSVKYLSLRIRDPLKLKLFACLSVSPSQSSNSSRIAR